MTRTIALLVCGLLVSAPSWAQQEVIAAIHVHGNTITPSAEVLSISGLKEGSPFSDEMRAAAEERLRASGRFYEVDVLKRYASISDPSQISVLIQVDDGPVRIDPPVPDGPGLPAPGRVPAAVRRGPLHVMFAPILTAEDGYGFTYGGRFAIAGHRDTTRRVIVPLSWGGDKRAGVELQKEFSRRFVPDFRTGAFVQRRTHPFFARQTSELADQESRSEANADRTRIWARADWALTRRIRAGSEVGWQESRLIGEREEAKSVGGDVVFDTRVDPLMPHNAIYARAAVEKMSFLRSSAVKTDLEINGYSGLYRGIVLALRGIREDMSEPAPAFYKSLLGGSANLRGFRAGHSIGDTLTAGSAEVRMPMTSALHVVRFGTSVFMDVGAVYDKGERLADQKLERGVGGGVWVTAPLFRISLMVARGLGSGTRVHFGAGVTF